MRLNIAAMISHLDLSDLPYRNAIRHILSIAKSNNLPLYFDDYRQLFGVKCNDVYIAHYENSDTGAYSGDWSGCGFVENINHEIRLPELQLNEGHDLKWTIWNFFVGEDQYLLTDIDGVELMPKVISDLDIYCLKAELFASGLIHLNANDEGITDSETCKSEALKDVVKKDYKTTKLENQIIAFKRWLISESKLDSFDDSNEFYQSCYRKIGRPTREEVWERLVICAPDFFSAKQNASIKTQNFFNRSKGGQSIVSFEGNER